LYGRFFFFGEISVAQQRRDLYMKGIPWKGGPSTRRDGAGPFGDILKDKTVANPLHIPHRLAVSRKEGHHLIEAARNETIKLAPNARCTVPKINFSQ
jgi:hypothetical protein